MGVTSLYVDKLPERHSGVFPVFRAPAPLVSIPSDLLSIARRCYLEKDYKQAESKLNELLSENTSNKDAIALLIRVYSSTSRFSKARDLFEESRKSGNADKSVYTAFISSCNRSRTPYETYTLEGYELIDEARRTGNIMPEAFASLISYYGRVGAPFLSESLFEKAEGHRDAEVYSSFISACCGDPWKAERILDRAQNEGILSPQMFKNLVRHYSDSQMTHDARRIFDWAGARNMLDSELCEMMMRCYLYNPHEEKATDARNIFDLALERGLLTHYMCSLMGTGYMDSKMPEKAEEIFRLAEQFDFADDHLASVVMRSYASAGKKNEAKEFLFRSMTLEPANTNAVGMQSDVQM